MSRAVLTDIDVTGWVTLTDGAFVASDNSVESYLSRVGMDDAYVNDSFSVYKPIYLDGTADVPTLGRHVPSKSYVDTKVSTVFTTTVNGAVPAPTTVSGKFLKDDGTWAAAAGGGGGDVMWVGTDPPADSTIEIWYDTDDTTLAGALDQATADTLYVNVNGDSMTGPLVITNTTESLSIRRTTGGAFIEFENSDGSIRTGYLMGMPGATPDMRLVCEIGPIIMQSLETTGPIFTVRTSGLREMFVVPNNTSAGNPAAKLSGNGIDMEIGFESGAEFRVLRFGAEKFSVNENGTVTLSQAPATNLEAATKQYVDTVAINAQTGTTYTLVLADQGKLVTCNNAAAITLTVPANSTVAYPVGTQIHLAQLGAGRITVAVAGGVTVSATPSLQFRAQYSMATLIKTGTDTWLLTGDLLVP